MAQRTVRCRDDGCESCIGKACTQLWGKGRYFGRVDTADEDKAEDNHREEGGHGRFFV